MVASNRLRDTDFMERYHNWAEIGRNLRKSCIDYIRWVLKGLDGSYLAEFLLEKGYEVHGTIRRSSVDFRERIAHLEGRPHFHLHYADLGDSMSILQVVSKVRPTEIYNLAAQSHVQVSFDSPEFTADAKKPVVYCGDLNVAHREIDLKNPKTNRQNPGFSDEEREKMTRLLGSGFVDTFRYIHGDVENRYSWWSYRFHAREKNVGWRIDYFIVSERLKDRIKAADIRSEIYGSDHCPVVLELEV